MVTPNTSCIGVPVTTSGLAIVYLSQPLWLCYICSTAVLPKTQTLNKKPRFRQCTCNWHVAGCTCTWCLAIVRTSHWTAPFSENELYQGNSLTNVLCSSCLKNAQEKLFFGLAGVVSLLRPASCRSNNVASTSGRRSSNSHHQASRSNVSTTTVRSLLKIKSSYPGQ